MKMKKRFFALALAALSVFSLMAPAGAVNPSYSGISFTNGVSRRFLFSDSPEAITSSNSTNGYLAGTTFNAGERMDFELYHHNKSGTTKRFGIVVQNGNSTAVTLTLHNKAIGTASGATQKAEQQMTAIMVRDYLKSSFFNDYRTGKFVGLRTFAECLERVHGRRQAEHDLEQGQCVCADRVWQYHNLCRYIF